MINEFEVYEATLNSWPITLRVMKENPNELKSIDHVRFYRWDAKAGMHKTLFVDYSAPFEYTITDPDELNYGYNQIFADSYDVEDDVSDSITFFILRFAYAFLPVAAR